MSLDRPPVARFDERAFLRSLSTSVGSSLITAFVLAWLGGTVVLAALGSDGSAVRLGPAFAWFLLMGIVGATVLHGSVAAYELWAGRAWSGERRVVARLLFLAFSFALAAVTCGFYPVAVAAPTQVASILGAGAALGSIPLFAGKRDRWLARWWRLIAWTCVVAAPLMLLTGGLALGLIFQRAAT